MQSYNFVNSSNTFKYAVPLQSRIYLDIIGKVINASFPLVSQSQELNRLNLESSNTKYSTLGTDSSMSYIDSSVISPDLVPLSTGGSVLSKQPQNKPKSGRSLMGGPAALSPLTPR